MSGYSKIKAKNSKQSPEFSDLLPNHVSKTSPKNPKSKQTKPKSDSKNSSKLVPESDDGVEKGENFGVLLNRASSVSSGSRIYKYENNGKLSAVRRAFSMSRSSSASERYSRIHHQGVIIASPFDHVEENNDYNEDFVVKKKSRKGKFLKACKSLFRL